MFKRINYLNNLLHYLNEMEFFTNDYELDLKSIYDYLCKVLNSNSATDNTCMLNIKRLYERAGYFNKYIGVTIDFYKEL